MKKIFILLTGGLGLLLNAYSQNIGVNTTVPDYPVDVFKNGGGYSIRLLNPSNTTGSMVGILFTNSASYSTTPFFSAYVAAVRQAAGGNALTFGTGNTFSVPGERMRLDSGGNLGIGTTSPGYTLHLYRNDPNIGFYDDDDNQFSGKIEGDSADLRINAYRKPDAASGIPGNLILQANISGFTPGNVGIGTTTPDTRLHITNGTDLSLSGGGYLQLGAASSQNMVFDNNEIQSRDNGAAADLFIQKDGGKIAIGTGTIATGYLVSVDGKIICSEVRVELKANWPDYVFDKNYQLPGLQKLEEYIRTNKHLPGIPSAQQVSKEGFDLGDMNRRLLEKVEELTLYIIEQDKKIGQLQQQMMQLQKKN